MRRTFVDTNPTSTATSAQIPSTSHATSWHSLIGWIVVVVFFVCCFVRTIWIVPPWSGRRPGFPVVTSFMQSWRWRNVLGWATWRWLLVVYTTLCHVWRTPNWRIRKLPRKKSPSWRSRSADDAWSAELSILRTSHSTQLRCREHT